MEKNKSGKRKIYMDFLRIIAIYMVLFNHTGTNGFMLFLEERASRFYGFYMFNAILIKVAVPLFFMVSGALLLGKEESYRDLLINRFLKYAVVLVGASLVMYLYRNKNLAPDGISAAAFFKTLYTSQVITAYWYLYAYLAYILMLPLLRKLARAMTDRDYIWMFILYGCMQSLQIIDFLLWKGTASHNSNFAFFFTLRSVFYPLMGYYIDRRMKEEHFNLKNLILLSAAAFAAILICCAMTQYRCTLLNEWTSDSCEVFFNTLIFLPTIAVFCSAKMWFSRHPVSDRMSRLITTAGSTTFGIFLMELVCRNATKPLFLLLKPYIHTLPACWIWIFAACVFGGVVTLVLKRIPGINRLI